MKTRYVQVRLDTIVDLGAERELDSAAIGAPLLEALEVVAQVRVEGVAVGNGRLTLSRVEKATVTRREAASSREGQAVTALRSTVRTPPRTERLGVRRAIARRLRHAREAAGLTQYEVADSMGWPRPTYSEIEAGRRSVRAEELGELAYQLCASPNWLLLGREAP